MYRENGNCFAKLLGAGVIGRGDQGTSSVVIDLDANDEVWVKHVWPASAGLRGDYLTSFTGFIVFQI